MYPFFLLMVLNLTRKEESKNEPVVSRKIARHLSLILSLPSAVVRMEALPMKSPLIKLEPIFFLSLPSAVVRVVASVMNSR